MPRPDLRERRPSLPQMDERGRPFPPILHDDLPAEIVLARLANVRERGGSEWSACCPAHPDTNPSLSLTETADHTLLLYCHAGCDTPDVLKAIGLSKAFLYPTPHALRCAGRTRPRELRTWVVRPGDRPVIDTAWWGALAARYAADPRAAARVEELAGRTGVDAAALHRLGVGWDEGGRRWAIPERDGDGRVVGVSYRYASGQKSGHLHAHRGLIFPADLDRTTGPLYLPEGMTDTAALLTGGAAAVGRPAAKITEHVRAWLADAVEKYGGGLARPVIVVGDRDAAGIAGASSLAEQLTLMLSIRTHIGKTYGGRADPSIPSDLVHPVRWALPRRPHKDVRDQLLACGDPTPVLQENGL